MSDREVDLAASRPTEVSGQLRVAAPLRTEAVCFAPERALKMTIDAQVAKFRRGVDELSAAVEKLEAWQQGEED